MVGADPYLLQLVRYIHKNPVKAGLMEKPEQYAWSSHKGYLSVAGKCDWLYKDSILSMLSPKKQNGLKLYKAFMSLEDAQGVDQIVAGKKWPAMIGTDEFIDWVKGKYYSSRPDEDVPEARQLIPDQAKIIEAVCRYYGIDGGELFKSQRGVLMSLKTYAFI